MQLLKIFLNFWKEGMICWLMRHLLTCLFLLLFVWNLGTNHPCHGLRSIIIADLLVQIMSSWQPELLALVSLPLHKLLEGADQRQSRFRLLAVWIARARLCLHRGRRRRGLLGWYTLGHYHAPFLQLMLLCFDLGGQNRWLNLCCKVEVLWAGYAHRHLMMQMFTRYRHGASSLSAWRRIAAILWVSL